MGHEHANSRAKDGQATWISKPELVVDLARAKALGNRLSHPELCGVHEAAQLLGIDRTTLHHHIRKGNFPEPVARLKMGPVWTRHAVEEWQATRGKAR